MTPKNLDENIDAENFRDGQKTDSSKERLGELIKSGIGRDGVDSPAHEKSSGISSYNSDNFNLQNNNQVS